MFVLINTQYPQWSFIDSGNFDLQSKQSWTIPLKYNLVFNVFTISSMKIKFMAIF